jgi:hypothetical protein
MLQYVLALLNNVAVLCDCCADGWVQNVYSEFMLYVDKFISEQETASDFVRLR